MNLAAVAENIRKYMLLRGKYWTRRGGRDRPFDLDQWRGLAYDIAQRIIEIQSPGSRQSAEAIERARPSRPRAIEVEPVEAKALGALPTFRLFFTAFIVICLVMGFTASELAIERDSQPRTISSPMRLTKNILIVNAPVNEDLGSP